MDGLIGRWIDGWMYRHGKSVKHEPLLVSFSLFPTKQCWLSWTVWWTPLWTERCWHLNQHKQNLYLYNLLHNCLSHTSTSLSKDDRKTENDGKRWQNKTEKKKRKDRKNLKPRLHRLMLCEAPGYRLLSTRNGSEPNISGSKTPERDSQLKLCLLLICQPSDLQLISGNYHLY